MVRGRWEVPRGSFQVLNLLKDDLTPSTQKGLVGSAKRVRLDLRSQSWLGRVSLGKPCPSLALLTAHLPYGSGWAFPLPAPGVRVDWSSHITPPPIGDWLIPEARTLPGQWGGLTKELLSKDFLPLSTAPQESLPSQSTVGMPGPAVATLWPWGVVERITEKPGPSVRECLS